MLPNFAADKDLKKIIPILIVGVLIASSPALAQKEKVLNLPKFDHQVIHFGFLLGVNSADFILKREAPRNVFDSAYTIETQTQAGFNLGIVSALHFNEYFSLRFTPALSFAQRNLEYEFLQHDTTIVRYTKPVESTYIDFPFHIKYKSARLNNFSAYIIAGGKYSLDLASNKDVNNTNAADIVVKLKQHDYAAEVGFGTDFYLPYFKFAIELKMSYGLKNIMIHDNTMFSSPIDRLRSKMFLLSLTFEG